MREYLLTGTRDRRWKQTDFYMENIYRTCLRYQLDFTQLDVFRSAASAVFIYGSVMLSCCVHIFMPKHIRYKIYIAGFTVQ